MVEQNWGRSYVPNPDSEYAETAAETPAGAENIAADDGYSPLDGGSTSAGLGGLGGLAGLGGDDAIADVVGPGALNQSVGPIGSREAVHDGYESRIGSSDNRLGHLPSVRRDIYGNPVDSALLGRDHQAQYIDPVAAELLGEDERGNHKVAGTHYRTDADDDRLLGDIQNLDATTARLSGYDAGLGLGGFWANLRTGRIERGEGGGDSYIGPFRSEAEARNALNNARTDYRY